MVRLLEGGRNLGIDIDHHVAILHNLLVSLSGLDLDEVGKSISQDGIDNVHDPLLWEVSNFFLDWEKLMKVGILSSSPFEQDWKS